LTEDEQKTEEKLSPVLHYALATLKQEHTLDSAKILLRNAEKSNKNIVKELGVLSKCNHEGIRNLAIYCIEAAFPDSNAIWKRIIRDGIVIQKEEMKDEITQEYNRGKPEISNYLAIYKTDVDNFINNFILEFDKDK
jgi:hypothetical protein